MPESRSGIKITSNTGGRSEQDVLLSQPIIIMFVVKAALFAMIILLVLTVLSGCLQSDSQREASKNQEISTAKTRENDFMDDSGSFRILKEIFSKESDSEFDDLFLFVMGKWTEILATYDEYKDGKEISRKLLREDASHLSLAGDKIKDFINEDSKIDNGAKALHVLQECWVLLDEMSNGRYREEAIDALLFSISKYPKDSSKAKETLISQYQKYL